MGIGNWLENRRMNNVMAYLRKKRGETPLRVVDAIVQTRTLFSLGDAVGATEADVMKTAAHSLASHYGDKAPCEPFRYFDSVVNHVRSYAEAVRRGETPRDHGLDLVEHLL